MKKLKYLLLLLLVPMVVKADVSINGEEKELDSSSIIYGEEVTSENTTKGIEFLLGNSVTFNGNSDYALILGSSIDINGTINNDGFIIGGEVNINENANVNRDLIILADMVNISGKVERDIKIYATTVNIKGEVGNLDIKASMINLENASINKLSYNEDAVFENNNSKVNETNLTEKISQEVSIIDNVMNFIINLVSMLVLFAVICLIVPKLFNRINEKNKKFDTLKFFSLFGFGALSLILIPTVAILLFRLAFTIPLALLLLVLFVIAICLATIFTGYLLGCVIWNKFIKKEENSLLIGLIGISIITILTSIPNIGIIFMFISIMIGMGIILEQFKKD